RAGIDSVVLEDRSREYVEHRVRAGVLEQPSVDLLTDLGLADRLHREGLVHEGIYLQFEGERHRIAMTDLTGRHITIYGQQELVKDLIAARQGAGLPLHFEVQDVRVDGVDGTWAAQPLVRYRSPGGVEHELQCDLVAGCDGSRGVSRSVIPNRVL